MHTHTHPFIVIFDILEDFSRQRISRIVTFTLRKFYLCVFEQPKQHELKFTGSFPNIVIVFSLTA